MGQVVAGQVVAGQVVAGQVAVVPFYCIGNGAWKYFFVLCNDDRAWKSSFSELFRLQKVQSALSVVSPANAPETQVTMETIIHYSLSK
jgi:hypothetical protein